MSPRLENNQPSVYVTNACLDSNSFGCSEVIDFSNFFISSSSLLLNLIKNYYNENNDPDKNIDCKW